MTKIGYSFIHNSSSIQHRAQAVDAGRRLLYVSIYILPFINYFSVYGLPSDYRRPSRRLLSIIRH